MKAVSLSVAFGASLAMASPRILDKRSVQSSALCIDEFSWMSNSVNQSPCLVAAWLLSQCAGGGELRILSIMRRECDEMPND